MAPWFRHAAVPPGMEERLSRLSSFPGDRSRCPLLHSCSGHQAFGAEQLCLDSLAAAMGSRLSCHLSSVVRLQPFLREVQLANDPWHHPWVCATARRLEEPPPPSSFSWCSCACLLSAHLRGAGRGGAGRASLAFFSAVAAGLPLNASSSQSTWILFCFGFHYFFFFLFIFK